MYSSKVKANTDICILVEDVERTIRFYTEKLDFKLCHRAESFVGFHNPFVTLAAWELGHIHAHTDVSNQREQAHGR